MENSLEGFEIGVENDPALYTLTAAVAEAVPVEPGRRFVGAETAAIGLALLVIYHFAKNRLDYDRGQVENELVRDRAALIKELTDEGIPHKEASATIRALHEQVQKGRLTDGVWEKIVALLGKK